MGLASIAQKAKDLTDYEIDQKIDRLFRTNPSLKHLRDNQDLIFDIIKKYKEKRRRGIKISGRTIRRDTYQLYKNRLSLGLTLNDLDDLRKLLETFKQ
ncbi:hypothetical protein GX917_03050 [Candidatus Falkowbacteria bacterium]|jgi:hypothetical protein|nr:hypothetical protein [Candidatus Falkowbacteria bacterium]